MKANRFDVECVYDELSKCQGCCEHCPSKRLKKYIDELGMNEFYRRYEANELPSEMLQILMQKIDNM